MMMIFSVFALIVVVAGIVFFLYLNYLLAVLSHKINGGRTQAKYWIYWPTAVVLSGAEWFEQRLEKGLFLASDYNICGLEDAFITGVYAANQICAEP